MGKRLLATFGVQLPVSKVLYGQSTVSNVGDINKVEESCLKNISGPAETSKIEEEPEVSTNLVEYSARKYFQTVIIRQ